MFSFPSPQFSHFTKIWQNKKVLLPSSPSSRQNSKAAPGIPRPWYTHTFSQFFNQILILILLWWEFANVIKVPKQLTLKTGRFSRWAWPNHMNPKGQRCRVQGWKKAEIRSTKGMWCTRNSPLLALKTEGATWQGMRVACRSWEQPLAESQQGNRDLNPMTTKNWILPQPCELERRPGTLDENTAQPIPWFQLQETLRENSVYHSRLIELWANKWMLF